MADLLRWFSDLTVNDVPLVGGKNASLGEMVATLASEGVPVPNGFATTAEAYWLFLDASGLRETDHRTRSRECAPARRRSPRPAPQPDARSGAARCRRSLPTRSPRPTNG